MTGIFLKIGIMLACFQLSESTLVLSDLYKISEIWSAVIWTRLFMRLGGYSFSQNEFPVLIFGYSPITSLWCLCCMPISVGLSAWELSTAVKTKWYWESSSTACFVLSITEFQLYAGSFDYIFPPCYFKEGYFTTSTALDQARVHLWIWNITDNFFRSKLIISYKATFKQYTKYKFLHAFTTP